MKDCFWRKTSKIYQRLLKNSVMMTGRTRNKEAMSMGS